MEDQLNNLGYKYIVCIQLFLQFSLYILNDGHIELLLYIINNITSTFYKSQISIFFIFLFDLKILYVYLGSYKKIVIGADKCTGSSTCASDADIINFYTGNEMQMFTINSYYDRSNTTNPIQYYIDDNYSFSFNDKPHIRILLDQTKVNLK